MKFSVMLMLALIMSCMLLFLSMSMSPGLWSIGIHLHSAFTESYVPGHNSVLHQQSQRTGSQGHWQVQAIMERQLAASINILAKTSTMYYWKGQIQEASEILMLVKTKTSRIQQVLEYVRSLNPYANPEVLRFRLEDGSLAYMKWMDGAVLDD
ncbi:hypothetical protein Q5P01_024932 [Channa striata]|uniref:Uncharacterized protein n=1 Tax=Channa striata TaxID=64152 RepID=A0AA88LJD0_CHASR|nr:hypothetical protein Q5P01_024932 [Channa striata]